MKKIKLIIFLLLVLGLAISCSSSDLPILTISGLTDTTFTQKDFKAMEKIEAEYTNKDNVTTIYIGVPIGKVIYSAGVENFANLAMIAADDYTVTVSFEELSECGNCILTLKGNADLNAVMPGFMGKFQVKDVVQFVIE